MDTVRSARRPRAAALRTGAAVLLAWAGMVVHNLADLPALTPWSPENTLPGLLWLALLALWLAFPGRRWPGALLLLWGGLNLAGGIASVLPLPLLPFQPEQSVRHYFFHALYAGAQLPLLMRARAGPRPDPAAFAA